MGCETGSDSKCPRSISFTSCCSVPPIEPVERARLLRCLHIYGVSPGEGVSRPCLLLYKLSSIYYIYTSQYLIYTSVRLKQNVKKIVWYRRNLRPNVSINTMRIISSSHFEQNRIYVQFCTMTYYWLTSLITIWFWISKLYKFSNSNLDIYI